jgi:hypothetical protein
MLMLNDCIVKLLVEKESNWISFITIQQHNNSSFYPLCSIVEDNLIILAAAGNFKMRLPNFKSPNNLKLFVNSYKKMPASKSRHHHKPVQQHHNAPELTSKSKKTNRTVIATVLFFAVLGLCVGLFINTSSIITLFLSTVLGAAAGFFAGYFINKSLSGK